MRRVAACALALATAALAAGCSGSPAATGRPVTEPAPEPSGERSAPFVLVPGAAAERIVVRASAGERVRLLLRLANGAGAARAFALSATTPWIAVPARAEVPPRASVPVTAVLSVPAGTAPGIRSAQVTARAGGRPGAAVAVRYESSVPVRVRVVARDGA